MKIIVLMEDSCGSVPGVEAEHGLSLYIETKHHKLLMDTGASGLTWKNAKALGVPVTEIDIVVISHGHYDHAGGLLGFVEVNPNAEIYLRRNADGDFYHKDRYIGIDKRIMELPRLHFIDGKTEINAGEDEKIELFTGVSGRILWPASNRSLSIHVNGQTQQDDFSHEQCLVIRESGMDVLLSGCAHNGVINIVNRFEEVYGKTPDVLVSGFHMIQKRPYTLEEEEEIRETARFLSKRGIICYTGHCTGEKAIELMEPILNGDKRYLYRLYTGLEIRLG